MNVYIISIVIAIVVGVWYYSRHSLSHKVDGGTLGKGEVFGQISAQNFKEQSSGGIIIDVRTSEEYATGHIPSATLIDVSGSEFKTQINQLDSSVPYYLYCKSGSRSAVALEIMKERGFKEVYGLEGGMNAWRKAGFSVE